MWWTDRRIAVAAVVLLVVTMPVVAQVGGSRQTEANDHRQATTASKVAPVRQAAQDYDGDGIKDSQDACPRRPETKNGKQDGDGCPDVVATTGAS